MADQQKDLVQDNPGALSATGLAAREPGKVRRVKIFTVHGTFANEAPWDDWDPVAVDELKKAADVNNTRDAKHRNFINRLHDHLASEGVTFDEMDHTQYNWSGCNSHDERRAGAIGLKKLIEQELQKTYAEKGRDYYNGGVYVIGHSHGGTISRLAMNLWDKDSDYYKPETRIDPVTNLIVYDEFKNDDHCPHCKEERYGKVGPNNVPRPDRVITFGSPFVTFEHRQGGLLAANIMLWVFRALLLAPLILYYFVVLFLSVFGTSVGTFWGEVVHKTLTDPVKGVAFFSRPEVEVAFLLLVPLALYWLFARYTPRRFVLQVEHWTGKGNLVNALAFAARLVSVAGLVALGFYYVSYFIGDRAGIDMWANALSHPAVIWLATWVLPIILYWLLAFSFAGRSLAGLGHEVARLRKKLPIKYDPSEDKRASYLSYHTPGDEPGLGLRLQGFNTWLVQTLVLSTACVLAVGIPFAIIGGIEAVSLTEFAGGQSVLANVGLSPLSADQQQGRFIGAMDLLTALPSALVNGLAKLPVVSSWLSNVPEFNLGALPNSAEVAPYVPFAMLSAFATILFGLMPSVLAALAIAYLVSLWLRNSIAGFGNERFAWTLANRIAVCRRANSNTMLRTFNISPEAWWNREIAHGYYYKCESVTKDVAKFIADPGLHKPDPASWPIGRIAALTLRWFVVAMFVLGMFAIMVPSAKNRHARLTAQPVAKEQVKFAAGYPFQDCAPACPVMIVLPTGDFWMGSLDPDGDATELPKRQVTIAKPFAVSKTDVTFAQWDFCVASSGCNGYKPDDENQGRGSRAVVNVSWNDANAYVQWLNSSNVTGGNYRLLSEAEWEYAARAGTTTTYFWGDDIGTSNASCIGCGSYWDNLRFGPAGSFKPNAFGLYDMHGLVWQWVADPFHPDYKGAPVDGSVWLNGGDAAKRIIRGGSALNKTSDLRVTRRGGQGLDTRSNILGFRVARDVVARDAAP